MAIFTPLYQIYEQQIELAGGRIREVPLKLEGSRFVFDAEELRAALKRPEVKILLLNSPSNPTGKVFTMEEMQTISSILDECPHVLTVHDSVYDFLTYDAHVHIPFASIGSNW